MSKNFEAFLELDKKGIENQYILVTGYFVTSLRAFFSEAIL